MKKETPIRILNLLYNLYDQNPTAVIATYELATLLKITINEAQGGCIYLKEKNWINSYQRTDNWYQKINAYGIDELERINSSLSKDDKTHSHSLDLDVENDDIKGVMKVFVSHKFVKEDQKLAISLQKMLKEKNIRGYLAERKREYQLLIRDKIRQEIDSSDYIVGIITKESRSSASVNQEIGYALGKDIPVVLLVEKGVTHGVLTHGREVEEFTRKNFEKPFQNVIDDILARGVTPRLTNEDKKQLIENVYRPCYNQMMNVYKDRDYINFIPSNKWMELEHFWRLKTEPEMKEKFERYTGELGKWKRLNIDFGNAFQSQENKLGKIVAKAFKKTGLLHGDDHIPLDEKSTMEPKYWLKAFDIVIFDPGFKNAEELYHSLHEHSKKIHQPGHPIWLENWWNNNNGFFTSLLEIIPELIQNFDCNVTKKQLDEHREALRKTVEDLTMALEEKLKS